MPQVSVVIPTHNRPEYLRLAIASVLNQTFQDFEIIVADDGSLTDEASGIANSFGDERIKYFRHSSCQGLSAARNTGIRAASGRYIALLDDDDEWLPEKLEKQVAVLDQSPPQVGVVYTGCLNVEKETGKVLGTALPSKRGDLFDDLRERDWVIAGGSTALIRQECFEKVGLFDESIPAGEAYDMWIRLARMFHFEYIAQPLAKYYYHGNKISTNLRMRIAGREVILDKYENFFEQNKRDCSGHYFRLGVSYCFDKNTRRGRKAFLRAIQFYPFELKYYLWFGLSLWGGVAFKQLMELKRLMFPLRHK
jgi:glycosyltransferase involved in cell wall biosynthesis